MNKTTNNTSTQTRPSTSKWVPRWSALSWLNVVALAGLWLVERYIGERFWYTNFITYVPQHLSSLPVLLLLFAAACLKNRRLILLNGAVLLVWALTFGGVNIPWQSTLGRLERKAFARNRTAKPHSLRVMSYNILCGLGGIDKLAQTIREQNPDVLCMQETIYWKQEPDPIPPLQELLPGDHMARVAEVTTFSKYPIVAQRTYNFPAPSSRAILETVLDVDGKQVHVYNVHLGSLQTGREAWGKKEGLAQSIHGSAAQRREQVDLLLNVTQSTLEAKRPALIVGDFNTPPRGRIYHALASRYTDAWSAAGWGTGNSFHRDLPVLRIDHVWMSSHWQARRAWVPESEASDHRPVVTDLVLEP
jgi:vancomycin resistance protein VanJ